VWAYESLPSSLGAAYSSNPTWSACTVLSSGESVGAGAHGAGEEVAVGHAVRVATYVEESLAAQGDQGSGGSAA